MPPSIACGSGAPQNFTSLEIPFTDVDKIFATHHHVDHIGGSDHFWIGGWTYRRTTPLRVWGPPGTDKIVEHLRGIYEWDIETRLDALPPGGHEIECSEFGQDGEIYDNTENGGVKITAFKVVHCEPQNTFAMKVEFKNRTFVFSADTKKCDSMLHHAAGQTLLTSCIRLALLKNNRMVNLLHPPELTVNPLHLRNRQEGAGDIAVSLFLRVVVTRE